MAAVKGSAQYRMRVMPYRPMRRVFNYVLGFLILLAVSLACYLVGYDHGTRGLDLPGMVLAGQQGGQTKTKYDALIKETESLRRQVAKYQLNETVDRKANEDIRNQLLQQTAQIAALERDITVYRGMVASGRGNPQGISVGIFYVTPAETPNRYHYKLAVQKLVASDEAFDGSLVFKLQGTQKTADAERSTSFNLYQLSDQFSAEKIPLSFKYFQNVEGDLILPEGFTPKKVLVQIKSTSKKQPVSIEKELEWQVSEL